MQERFNVFRERTKVIKGNVPVELVLTVVVGIIGVGIYLRHPFLQKINPFKILKRP